MAGAEEVHERRKLECPACGATDCTVVYHAEVHVIVEDGKLQRVIVHDDSAGTAERVRCSHCGTEQPASMAAVAGTRIGMWVAAVLDLCDDTQDDAEPWPDWQIGSW